MLDPKLHEAFNNIKNHIYKNASTADRYDFSELAEIFVKEDWTSDELEAIEQLKRYVNGIKLSVEDLGTKIIDITTLDFSNKIRLEEFIKDIIMIIDEFVDSLVAITMVVEFDENRLNVEMSLARLKSLRNSLIKKMNEYSRLSNGINLNKEQAKFMSILLTDIIDSIIKESFQLRIQKLSEVLDNKF